MPDDLGTALGYHQRGHLDQATLIYRGILARDPNHVDALHLLGLVSYQRGDHQQAVDLIGRAVALRPQEAIFHYNLAEAYRAGGNLSEAVAHCQTALRLRPDCPEAENNLGLALQEQGKRDEAAAHFRHALRLKPDYAQASNNLGNVLREQGKDEEAIAAFGAAVRLQPSLAQAHGNLGQMLMERGQVNEALVHCREAVRLQPHSPQALNNLGNVLRKRGQREEAKECYARVIRLQPGLAMPHNNLGQALEEEGHLDQAMAHYQEALRLEPHSARIHCNLASALHEKGRSEEAAARYRLALQLQPDYAPAHNGLGYVLQDQGDLHAALACYRRTLQIKPSFAPAHANQGQVLADLGEFDQSVTCLREALRHDPNHAAAYASLANVLGAQLPEADVATIPRLLAEGRLSEGKQIDLHFALAHVLDARREYDAAADHVRQANALCKQLQARQGKTWDLDQHLRLIDHLIESFTVAAFDHVRGWGLESELPVFNVGLPRSGKTLVEQILAGHSQVYGTGELHFTWDSFQALATPREAAGVPFVDVSRWEYDTVALVARRHLDRLQALDPAAGRIVDTGPENYLWLGLIAMLFPRARIIHCRRDPRDVAVACWMMNFRRIRWACDVDHLASRIGAYQRLMDHWRQVLPVPMLEVDYEETVTNLERTARRLVAWCGLEWEPACLDFGQARRSPHSLRLNQVRLPLHSRFVQHWRNYQGPLAPLLDRLVPNPPAPIRADPHS